MIKVTKLENGVTVASDYMSNVETVSLHISVKVGSRNETQELNGISHLIEHMMFKGTKKRNAEEIANAFENIGASFNASTSKEVTTYYGKVLKEYSENLFEILSDMVFNSTFDETELEREKNVVIQEIAMTNDAPDDIISDYYSETAFSNQAFGRTILGPEENIKKFTSEDLVNYVKNNYTADNIFITCAGNLKHEELLNIVNKYLSQYDINKTRERELERAKYTGGYFVKNKDLEQVQCLFGFKGLGCTDKNLYKFMIINNILGGGMSSRLFQDIREKKGLCYTIYSANCSTYETGSFEIYLATDPEKVNFAIESIIKELKNIVKSGITEQEFNRAKISIKSAILMQLEKTSSRAKMLANSLIFRNKVVSVKKIINLIEKIKQEDLIDVLKHIISSKPTIAIYGNIKNMYEYKNIVKMLKD